MRADHAPDRKIGHRRIDVRHQVQPAGPEPGAFDIDIGQVDRNQLADFGTAIDARDQLQIDLGFRKRR